MTGVQVFEYFCRMTKIKPMLVDNYKKNGPIDWGKYDSVRYRNLPFDKFDKKLYYDVLQSTIHSFGFDDLVWHMTSGHYHEMRKQSQTFKEGSSKWFYFSKNNIKFDTGCIKVGDTIEYMTYQTIDLLPEIINAIVVEIDPKCRFVKAKRMDDNKTFSLQITGIKKVNGRKFKPNYVITRKRKIVAR